MAYAGARRERAVSILHQVQILVADVELDEVRAGADLIVPHLGSATIGTRTKMGNMAAENCLAACRGERPPNLVNPEAFDV